jgi:hypothetical protein
MSIFVEAAKRRIKEKQDEIAKQVALKGEQSSVAKSISEDVVDYMAAADRPDVIPALEDNKVKLRLRTSSAELVITCEGTDAFTVFDPTKTQASNKRDTLTRDTMVNMVLDWFEKTRSPTGQSEGYRDLRDE